MAKLKSGLIVSFLGMLLQFSRATPSDIYRAPFYPGEQLTYVVEFMSMEIARVTFTVLDPVDTLGTTLHHVKAVIQSNSRVPILVVKDIYESYFDDNFRPYFYRGQGVRRNFAFRLEYHFDQQNGKIHAWEYRQTGRKEKLLGEYHQPLGSNIFDCLTLFYYVRSYLQSLISYQPMKTDVFINGKIRPIEFSPSNPTHTVRYIDQMISAIPMVLKLGFKGIAGLKDRIKISLSADNKVIPLLGELKLILGKVKIRLIKYDPGRLPYVQAVETSDIGGKTSR